jgi:hypothetical protein
MSEVIRDAQHEFWRPPALAQSDLPSPVVSPTFVEKCSDCGTEFMVGARYCYVCGSTRQVQADSANSLSWTHYLEFHHIQRLVGLPIASLIAFLLGLGCLLAAISVGFIYAVQNFADFQAIQFWRMQWLLAAIAAFLAGILLKRARSAG